MVQWQPLGPFLRSEDLPASDDAPARQRARHDLAPMLACLASDAAVSQYLRPNVEDVVRRFCEARLHCALEQTV